MDTGVRFIQRMQEDIVFRQKVNACPNGAARLTFLKQAGYDFTPFMHILDNLSSGQPPAAKLSRPGVHTSHRHDPPGLWSRLSQIFRPAKSPARTAIQPHGVRRGEPSGGASF